MERNDSLLDLISIPQARANPMREGEISDKIFHVFASQLCSAVGLADVLSALFFLCGFNAYLEWTRNHHTKVLPVRLFASSALAMFSKEPGVTVLVSGQRPSGAATHVDMSSSHQILLERLKKNDMTLDNH